MKLVLVLLILLVLYMVIRPSGYVVPVNVLPTGIQWKDITYGNGYYVAVGDNSSNGSPNIAYSTDGVNWTPGATLPQGDWTSIVYGNGIFVVGCNNFNAKDAATWVYWFSTTDPKSPLWTPCNKFPIPLAGGNIPGYQCNQLQYGNGMFRSVGTLVGTSLISMQSSDGVNWSFDTNLSFPGTYASIARGVDRHVIVASYMSGNLPYAACLIDGESTWRLSTPNSSMDYAGQNSRVIYDSTKKLFITNIGFTSVDGLNWNRPYMLAASDIATNISGVLVSFQDQSIIYNNNNSLQFITATGLYPSVWYRVVCVNNMFIALGNGNMSAYSYDGLHWNLGTVYVDPGNQSCIFTWNNISRCVHGRRIQQLSIKQSSHGKGIPCPGNQDSGRVVRCKLKHK